MPEKILIVDDEQVILNVLTRILKKRNYEVVCAANGQEAIEILETESATGNFDIVISDILMPKMNGLGLARAMKESYPEIPLILMTGYSDQYPMEEALEAGARVYIMKPFTNTNVYDALSYALAQRCVI